MKSARYKMLEVNSIVYLEKVMEIYHTLTSPLVRDRASAALLSRDLGNRSYSWLKRYSPSSLIGRTQPEIELFRSSSN